MYLVVEAASLPAEGAAGAAEERFVSVEAEAGGARPALVTSVEVGGWLGSAASGIFGAVLGCVGKPGPKRKWKATMTATAAATGAAMESVAKDTAMTMAAETEQKARTPATPAAPSGSSLCAVAMASGKMQHRLTNSDA